MTNGKYRVAILGVGGMGKAHANVLKEMADVELAALCTEIVPEAEEYLAQTGLSCPIYTDFSKMLKKEPLDVLFVCLPPFAHIGQVEEAAAKGIHIFAEKPLALTVERAASMTKAAREAGIHSQMGYQMRFGGAVQELKRRIEDGIAGTPTLFTARYECNSLHKPWWIRVEQCGGQVFEQVIHLYDMALYFMGDADVVSGFTANLEHQNVPGYTVEDTSAASIRFKNGSLGNISGSNCAVPGNWLGMFRIVCGNLVADFQTPDEATFTYIKDGKPFAEHFSAPANQRQLEVEHFMDVLRGKKAPFATFEDGLNGLRLVAGVVHSSEQDGAPVRIG